jgi:transcription elongation factor GreB
MARIRTIENDMKKKMLTQSGHEKLSEEHHQLWSVVRPEVVQRISDAAAEGDRSENAEYIYGKKRLRELDSRIRYLASLMEDATVVEPVQMNSDRVQFGATVELENEDGDIRTWMIVGEGEANPKIGTISYRAPIAQAMLGKTVGDEVVAKLPERTDYFDIVGLRYVNDPPVQSRAESSDSQ